MGLSSATTNFIDNLQLCIFDLGRGQFEGQELDKILFFFPAECPFTTQLSVIGLCEGIITFTRIFSPDAGSEVIEADRHSHVFYQPEPDIWMVMVVENQKDSESIWRCDALRDILKEVHSLFMMFHGSVRSLLDKQPSGELARSLLHTFILDYLTEFQIGKGIHMPSFRECLRERRTVQMLTMSRETAIEVQSLVATLGSSVANTTCNSVLLFQDLLVTTTLSPVDTTNIYTYAVMRLTPHALSTSSTSWSYLRRAKSASNLAAVSNMPNAGRTESHYASCDTSPCGARQRRSIPRPLIRDKWCKGKDGFVGTEIWGAEAGNSLTLIPTVWLKQMNERMCLCVYQHNNLTIILLIPFISFANGQGIGLVKKQLLENASQKIINVEEKLSRGWGGENAYHVSGYRYLIIDGDSSISRSTPPGKVTTLMKASLHALNKRREEVDSEKARARRDNLEREKDLEICIRARNNAWVIAKITRGKELYMVLEKASDTLLYASEALEKFSNRYCDGVFSLDE